MSGTGTGAGTGTGRPGPLPPGFSSRSTPNLPTLRNLNTKSVPQKSKTREEAAQQKSKTRDEAAQHKTQARDGGNTARDSHSTPRLSIDDSISPSTLTSPSEPASLEDFSLDGHPPDLSVSDASEESDEDTLPDNLPAPTTDSLYARPHFSRSNTYLGSATFAPPFYNRPPTPLPPSPSLTSLLRPNFSTAPSRPSTPDPSSDEGAGTTTTTTTTTNLATGAQTPNSAAATTLSSSFRTAKPIPRASPKVPTYEYYGFTLYLTSFLVFLIYLLWSFLPSPFLHQLGIYYYPNRWWSLAIPAWLVMLVVWIFVALASFNTGYMTLAMREVGCLIDEKGSIAVVDKDGNLLRGEQSSWTVSATAPNTTSEKKKRAASKKRSDASGKRESLEYAKDLDWRSLWNEGTDAVLDVPIGGVCEVLYGRPNGSDDEYLDGF